MSYVGITGALQSVALELTEGEWVDGALYLKAREDGWYLVSDVAFDDTYTLTATVDGERYALTVTDAQAVNLEDIKDSITATLDQSAVQRDQTLDIHITYDIQSKMEQARAGYPWIYDLNTLCGNDENAVFRRIIDEPDGIMTSGGVTVGTYVIENNTVRLYPYAGALSNVTEIQGTVKIQAELNENHNAHQTDDSVGFPGAAATTITYINKSVTAQKQVGAYYGDDKDGTSVNITLQQDGSYKLFYKVAVTPATKAYDYFHITDALSGGQTLDVSSISVTDNNGASMTGNLLAYTTAGTHTYNGQTVTTVDGTPSATGFVLDLKATLANWNQQVQGGKTYYLYYTTTIPADAATDQNGVMTWAAQNNTVTTEYDGASSNDATTVTPQFQKTITHSKRVGNAPGNVSHTNGESFSVVERRDGSGNAILDGNGKKQYDLYYEAELTTNAALDTLTIVDALGDGNEQYQTLDTSSVKLYKNGTEVSYSAGLNANANGFTLDVHTALGTAVPANTTIKVCYKATISENDMDKYTHNTATWSWSGTSESDSIEFKPKKSDKLYGIGKHAKHHTLKPGENFIFEIEVGMPVGDYIAIGSNVAGKKVTDMIYDYVTGPTYIKVVGAKYDSTNNKYDEDWDHVLVDWANGSFTTGSDIVTININPTNHSQGTSGELYELFNLEFKDNATANAAYARYNYFLIQYGATANSVAAGDPQILEYKTFKNTAYFEGRDDDTEVTIQYDKPTLEKSFVGFDVENNIAEWEVRVHVPEGAVLENWYVVDQWATGWAEGPWAGKNLGNLPYLTDEITVVNAADGGAVGGYTVTNLENSPYIWKILFPSLAQDAIIRIKTRCTEDIQTGENSWAKKTVVLAEREKYFVTNQGLLYDANGNEKENKTATGAYYNQDIGLNKEGIFNKESATADWVVDINANRTLLDTDITPYFVDRIPAGMELVDGAIHIQVFGDGTHVWSYDVPNFEVQVYDNEIGPINLVEAVASAYARNGHSAYAPGGLSGVHYRVSYTTRVTDAKLHEIQTTNQHNGYLDTYTFTNRASLLDGNGSTLKTDSETVTYEYDNLVTKTDTSSASAQRINYAVDINPNAERINGGSRLMLTDRISTDMTLMIDSIAVYSVVSGMESLLTENVTVSYEDNSRVMAVYVPDETHVRVKFSAIPQVTSGNHAYVNTVNLRGTRFSQTDTEEKYHVARSSATLETLTNSVSISKVDEHNLTLALPGAHFELYKYEPDDFNANGRIIGEADKIETDYVTGADGRVTFEGIEPNTLYYWVETEAPTDYMISDGSAHYFVLYQQLTYNGKVSVQWNKLSATTRAGLQAAFPNRVIKDYTDETTDRIIIAARRPDSDDDELIYYLTSYTPVTLSDGTRYNSLTEEVNAINLQEAYDLDDWVTDANDIVVACVPNHYNWTYTNVRDNMVRNTLYVSKRMAGRAMDANEFTFMLYDAADLDHPLQSIKNTAANEGVSVTMAFNPQSYVMAGNYDYVIREKAGQDANTVYDDSTYYVRVVVEENNGELSIAGVTYTKNGETVSYADAAAMQDGHAGLFVNRKNEARLTVTKTFGGDIPQSLNKNDVTFTVTDSSGSTVATFNYGQMIAGIYTITNVTAGETYTVTETNMSPNGESCVTTYTINAGTERVGNVARRMMGSEEVRVDFKNTYGDQKMELVVTKQWTYHGFTKDDNQNIVDRVKLDDPDDPPYGISSVYFRLYHRVNDVWTPYNNTIYVIRGSVNSKNWNKTISDLPIGVYKVVECASDGTAFTEISGNSSANDPGIRYFVGTSTANAHEMTDSDFADANHNHLYIVNRMARLKVHKRFYTSSGNRINGASNTGVSKVWFKIQRSDDSGATWYDLTRAVHSGDTPEWVDLTVNVPYIEIDGDSTTHDWDASRYVLPIYNPETGLKYHYRIVETKVELRNGTILDGQQAVALEYDLKQSYTRDDSTDCAEGIVLESRINYGDSCELYAKNWEKEDLITLQKRWFNQNGVEVTQTNSSQTIKCEKLRFKIRAKLEDGTEVDAKLHGIQDGRDYGAYWSFLEELNDDKLYRSSGDPEGTYTYDTSDGVWPELKFKYLFRAYENADGEIVVEDTPTYNGKRVTGFYFYETQIKVGNDWIDVSDSNYIASYSFNGSEFVPATATTGLYTITNTERRPMALTVTKAWFDAAGNAVHPQDEIHYQVVLVAEDGTTLTLPNTYRLVYNNGWPTATFQFDIKENFNGTEKNLKSVHVVETWPYDPAGTIYTFTPTGEGAATVVNKGGASSPVAAGTDGTVTIVNVPKVTPKFTKLWRYGNSAQSVQQWPGAVQSLMVQLYRYTGNDSANAEAVGSPVTVNGSTYLPYTFGEQPACATDGTPYHYIVRETEIMLLENGALVTKNLSDGNTYLVGDETTTAGNTVLTTLTNKVPSEQYTYIDVTKTWDHSAFGEDPDISDVGKTITFKVGREHANIWDFVGAADIRSVTNGTLNADGTITLTCTADGWPTCRVSLPAYRDGAVVRYYVEETAADSETGYYDITYNGEADCQKAIGYGLTITIQNKDIPLSNIKVTKRWLASDGTTDISANVSVDSITFDVMYIYDGWGGGTSYETLTIRRIDGVWETITLPQLPEDPGNQKKAAHYYIKEADHEDGYEGDYWINYTYKCSRLLIKDENGNPIDHTHFLNLSSDTTVTITNQIPAPDSTSIEVYKQWIQGGENITGKMGSDVSVEVELHEGDTTVPNSAVTLNRANGWHHTWTGLDSAKTYTVVETAVNGITGYTTTYSPASATPGHVLVVKNELSNTQDFKVIKQWVDAKGDPVLWHNDTEVTVELQKIKSGFVEPLSADERAAVAAASKPMRVTLNEDTQEYTWQSLPRLTNGYQYTAVEVYVDGIVVEQTEYTPSYDNATPGQTIVTNTLPPYGALRLTKLVKINDTLAYETGDDHKGDLDGSYIFRIRGPYPDNTVDVYVRIMVEDGVAKAYQTANQLYSGDDWDSNSVVREDTDSSNHFALITCLLEGDYAVEELAPQNGTTLIAAARGDNAATCQVNGNTVNVVDLSNRKVWVHVTANDTAAAQPSAVATFTNKNSPGLRIKKVDKDTQAPLSDAEFQIQKWNGTIYEVYPDAEHATVTTGADGYATFTKVEPGDYRIVEEKIPAGYVKLEVNDIYVNVDYDATRDVNLVTRYDKPVNDTPRATISANTAVLGVTYAQATLAQAAVTDPETGAVTTPAVEAAPPTFTVGNTRGTALPATGGPGTGIVYTAGIALVLLAILGFAVRSRRRGIGI